MARRSSRRARGINEADDDADLNDVLPQQGRKPKKAKAVGSRDAAAGDNLSLRPYSASTITYGFGDRLLSPGGVIKMGQLLTQMPTQTIVDRWESVDVGNWFTWHAGAEEVDVAGEEVPNLSTCRRHPPLELAGDGSDARRKMYGGKDLLSIRNNIIQLVQNEMVSRDRCAVS